MIFGRVPLVEARGGISAHSLKVKGRVLRKGAIIDDSAFKLLQAAGYGEITVARLEPGDMPEGDAASHLGERLLAPGLRRSSDIHGRVNLFAEVTGLLRLEVAKIERLNGIDEAITLATLADRSVVRAGDMIATLKIIPFAVSAETMRHAERLIAEGNAAVCVKAFSALKVGLILTTLPQLKEVALVNTIAATTARVSSRGGSLMPPSQTPHETAALRQAIERLLAEAADLVLISGASAVTDRLDIAPRAIIEAGGEISHFGMPVDPGNLICFGNVGAVPVVILPGCARSPKPNGIDWVLDRLFAGETINHDDLAKMGVGGLLTEVSRPMPRLANRASGFGATPKRLPVIAVLVLAAGKSSRTGPENKLLARAPDGRTLIEQTVDHAIASGAKPVIVVTGHQDREIRHALTTKPVSFVYATDFADGIAASLHAGIAALAGNIEGAIICLGDMPMVDASVLRRIIEAYDPAEGREIILPTYESQRGNPVLWGSRFFPELLELTGDAGGRKILHRHMEFVTEIPVASETVLQDFDTPERLAAFRGG